MANQGQDVFKERVKRIARGRDDYYYDPNTDVHVPKHMTPEDVRKARAAQKFSLWRMIKCILIGVVAVITAQGFRIRYFEFTAPDNAAMFTDLLLTVFFVLLFSALMQYRKKSHRAYQIFGAAAMLLLGHNLMFVAPREMAIIYSTPYVTELVARTQPYSVVWKDKVFSL